MTRGVYYNEWDGYAAQWLRNLIAAGHLPAGDVDERSITEVGADDLKGYTACHFFAGIGGWARALRLAGWDDTRPVWTGSCPCQPFSAAGKRKGVEDERHLWPEFRRLIAECDPPVVFGEQVASKDGRLWLAGVRADLEALGYAVGAADISAAGVGAPHIRQRVWWVADSNEGQRRRLADGEGRQHDGAAAGRQQGDGVAQSGGAGGGMGHADGPDGARQRPLGLLVEPQQETGRPRDATAWAGAEFIRCADGKQRAVKPGIFPLAHGVSARVGKLRAAGNAIVPEAGAAFIAAYMECQP